MSNIANIRRRRGLKQDHLAEMAGVSQPHISRIERGDDGPSLRVFKQIASALNVTLPDLFAEDRSDREAELLQVFRRIPVSKHDELLRLLRLAQADVPGSDQESDQFAQPSNGQPRQ